METDGFTFQNLRTKETLPLDKFGPMKEEFWNKLVTAMKMMYALNVPFKVEFQGTKDPDFDSSDFDPYSEIEEF